MIEVILRQDIDTLGKAGALVKVRPGYARNYLLPRGLAFEATAGNRKRIEVEQRSRQVKQAQERDAAQSLAATITALQIKIGAKAGEEGKLFGSVTAQEIADHLNQAGHDIDKRRIELEQPIRQVGHHTVKIRLHPEVAATVQIEVVAD